MGLSDFAEGIGDAVSNVGKGAAWAANPAHWDDIAEGAGKAAEFVVENPRKTWDVGFEVGRAMVKEQLDPINLAITAGLTAATFATAGAAAPTLLAKMGLTAKSATAGAGAIKGTQVGTQAARAVKTADTAADAAKAAKAAADAAKAAKVTRGLERFDKLAEPGKLARALNPIATRPGAGATRGKLAQKILDAPVRSGASPIGEAPSTGRQVVAALVQGTSRRAPKQLVGMSDEVYNAQKMLWRARQAKRMTVGTAQKANAAEAGVEVAADPQKAVMERATAEMDRRGVGQYSGYSDRGQTVESPYGSGRGPTTESVYGGAGRGPTAESVYQPPAASQVSSPSPGYTFPPLPGTPAPRMAGASTPTGTSGPAQATSPYSGGGAGGSGGPPAAPSGSASPPPGGGFRPVPNAPSATTGAGTPTRVGGGSTTRRVLRTPSTGNAPAGKRQHLWEGPRSQWLGGISANYDWRPVEPLRPITPGGGGAQGDLNEQGAPMNFSPEFSKSSIDLSKSGVDLSKKSSTSLSMGQQPFGALNPGQPRRFELLAGQSVPIGGSSAIAAEDSGTWPSFNFVNMMGAPMYRQGSRTSNRNTTGLGV
jgi:hypothetical protein